MWPFIVKENKENMTQHRDVEEPVKKHKLYYWCRYYINGKILCDNVVEDYSGDIILSWFSMNGLNYYISKRDIYGRIIRLSSLEALRMIAECAKAEGNHDVVGNANIILNNPKPHYSWFVSQNENGHTYE